MRRLTLWRVTSRGNDRQDIFFLDVDRTFFVELLRLAVMPRRMTTHLKSEGGPTRAAGAR